MTKKEIRARVKENQELKAVWDKMVEVQRQRGIAKKAKGMETEKAKQLAYNQLIKVLKW